MSEEKTNVFNDNALLRLNNKLKDDISEVPEVKELLELLKANKLDAQAKDFEVLLSSVDDIKTNFNEIIKENNYSIMKSPFKDEEGVEKISRATIDSRARRLSVDTFSVKHEILKVSEHIVNNFKDKGFIALNGKEFDATKKSLAKLSGNIKVNKVAVNNAINDYDSKITDAKNHPLYEFAKNLFYEEDNPFVDFQKQLIQTEGTLTKAVSKIDAISQNVVQSKEPTGIFVDMSAVTQLLDLLKQNQKAEQLATVQGLVDTISTIENNLNTAMAELKNVKAQLNLDTKPTLQNTIKDTAITQIQKLENGLQRLKNQLGVIKQKFVDTAQNIVDAVKDKSFSALDKTSEFMSLKENFTTLNDGINKNISRVDKTINTINSMTQELSAATKHFKNIGRAITGKERDGSMAQSSDSMVKPLKSVKKMLVAMEGNSANTVAKIDALSKRANRGKSQEEKPSILQKLKDEKVNVKEPKATNPKAKEVTI